MRKLFDKFLMWDYGLPLVFFAGGLLLEFRLPEGSHARGIIPFLFVPLILTALLKWIRRGR